MKKLLAIITLFLSLNASSQNIDTVSVSLTLRTQDWAWAIAKYGQGNDSTNRSRVRAIRTAMLAANPQTWATNVTINNVPGPIVLWIYRTFVFGSLGEMLAMGNNTAERTTIYTNIRAINNSVLQYHIGTVDATANGQYNNIRQNGKEILLDN
jgi:hypothetical protein